ncbi:MAG: hypothetical protein WBC44_03940 [Planctomycetaceae bacterium]
MKASFATIVLSFAMAGALTGCGSGEVMTPTELSPSEEEIADQEALQVENEEKLHALDQQQQK